MQSMKRSIFHLLQILMSQRFSHWNKRLLKNEKPAYLLLPELIAEDIKSGRLSAKEKLPTLREMSVELSLNYTTVARGYAQARKMGLIDSRVGMGTFVKGGIKAQPIKGGSAAEMTMNLPPEPNDPILLSHMRESAARFISQADVFGLLRYQDFGGTSHDREVAAHWVSRFVPGAQANQILVAPGIHCVLTALFSMLAKPGDTICVESLTYPGVKAIAAQLGIVVHPIELDSEGPRADIFEYACQTLKPKAFYCNPTLLNPTTQTISSSRRVLLADIALKYSVSIIEDDAYGMLPKVVPRALASLAPELTYYITGFSKCFGAGLRSAFVVSPNERASQRLAGALRATTVMASPITNALTTLWIEDNTADRMLLSIRSACLERQLLVTKYLGSIPMQTASESFHVWLNMVNNWNAVEFASYLRGKGVSVVASAAFSTLPAPAQAVRICLGGPVGLEECERHLKIISDTLNHPVHSHSTV
jgi:DNA-binding transcriptional MocR family regulator